MAAVSFSAFQRGASWLGRCGWRPGAPRWHGQGLRPRSAPTSRSARRHAPARSTGCAWPDLGAGLVWRAPRASSCGRCASRRCRAARCCTPPWRSRCLFRPWLPAARRLASPGPPGHRGAALRDRRWCFSGGLGLRDVGARVAWRIRVAGACWACQCRQPGSRGSGTAIASCARSVWREGRCCRPAGGVSVSHLGLRRPGRAGQPGARLPRAVTGMGRRAQPESVLRPRRRPCTASYWRYGATRAIPAPRPVPGQRCGAPCISGFCAACHCSSVRCRPAGPVAAGYARRSGVEQRGWRACSAQRVAAAGDRGAEVHAAPSG